MNTHTPGPWAPETARPYHIVGYRTDSENTPVCQVSGGNANADADARLIAAAPELLAELESLTVTATDNLTSPSPLTLQALRLAIADARAAILKAKGE